MLKLSKTIWFIIGLGIPALIIAGLGTMHSQQLDEHDQLNEELAQAQLRLNQFQMDQLYQQQQEMETEITEYNSQLAAAKANLSQPIDSISSTDTLFRIAQGSGVEIAGISSSGPNDGDLNGIPGTVNPFTLSAGGTVLNLIDFVIGLNTDLTTGLVGSVGISLPPASDNISDNSSDGGDEMPTATANIHLTIYSYQDD